jgi:hypothetical protein
MTTWRRRDILKSGLAAGVSLLAPGAASALVDRTMALAHVDAPDEIRATPDASPRERLRLDRGWRVRHRPDQSLIKI